MALADIKQRPGIVLGVAVVLHVAIISAQVNTATGMPVLRAVTFGAFAELQRIMTGGVTGVQDVWNGYVALRGVDEENAALRQQLQDLQIRLQEERALAQRTRTCASCSSCASAPSSRPPPPRSSPPGPAPSSEPSPSTRAPAIACSRHGRAVAIGSRRPGDPAEPPRLQGAAADRPQRGGRGDRRALPGAGRGGGRRRRRAADGLRAGDGGRQDRRPGGDLGHRRHLPQGLRHRHHRVGRARIRHVSPDSRSARGRLLAAGGSAGRDHASRGSRLGRGEGPDREAGGDARGHGSCAGAADHPHDLRAGDGDARLRAHRGGLPVAHVRADYRRGGRQRGRADSGRAVERGHGHRRAGQDAGGVCRGPDGHAVHRDRAAAAVRGVRRAPAFCTRGVHGPLRPAGVARVPGPVRRRGRTGHRQRGRRGRGVPGAGVAARASWRAAAWGGRCGADTDNS